MIVRPVLIVVVLAFLVSGCGGTNTPVRTGSTGSASAAADSPVPSCSLSDLRGSVATPADSGTGEHDDLITVANDSAAPCRLLGYPRIRLADRSKALPFHYTHGGGMYIPNRTPRTIVLRPAGHAYFLIAKYRCDTGIAATATRLELQLPKTDGSQIVRLTGTGVHQLNFCRHTAGSQPTSPGNRVAISPILGSASAALAGPR